MRKIILTVAPMLLSAASLFSQGVFSNKTITILERVIQDYPNRFHNIEGEQIGQDKQTTEYRSTIKLNGSPSCIVTRYKNKARTENYSWTCVVFEGQQFGKARDTFRELFSQIKNSIIRIGGKTPFILSGRYEEPAEGTGTPTQIIFSLLPAAADLKKLKVELSLHPAAQGWKITLGVYDSDLKEKQDAVTSN